MEFEQTSPAGQCASATDSREEATQLSNAQGERGGAAFSLARAAGGAEGGADGGEEGEGQLHSKSNRCVESTSKLQSLQRIPCVCPVSEARSA